MIISQRWSLLSIKKKNNNMNGKRIAHSHTSNDLKISDFFCSCSFQQRSGMMMLLKCHSRQNYKWYFLSFSSTFGDMPSDLFAISAIEMRRSFLFSFELKTLSFFKKNSNLIFNFESWKRNQYHLES